MGQIGLFENYFYWIGIIDYLFIWKFFTLALADGIPLDSERQQVSSSLQDSSQYPGWS